MSETNTPRRTRIARLAALDTLRGRLLLLVALATLPALAFILYAAARERSSAQRGAEAHATVLARLAAEEHARQLGAARSLLVRIAELSGPQDAAAESLCHDLLPALVAAESRFANVGLLSPSGALMCSAVPPPELVDLSRSSVLAAALRSREVVVGDYEVGPIVNRPVLYVAIAARDASGNVLRVAFAALDLRWLEGIVELASLPRGSVVTLFDRRGRVLARSLDSKRWVGRRLGPRAGFGQVARVEEGTFQGPGVDGVDRLWALHRLAGAAGPWVAIGIPSDVAFAEATRAQRRHVAGLLLALICALVLGMLGAELWVLRGVRGVTRAARLLAAGEPGVRAPTPQPTAEVRELAVAFNAMAAALELRQRQSEVTGHRLRALAARVQSAREEEAARIARELHDEVGQALTALKLDVAWFARSKAKETPEERATGWAALSARIDETIGIVRRLSQELRPALLDRLGLGDAIAWQARELEARAGVACTVEIHDLPAALDGEIAIAAFRIVQEALTNVMRHAGARKVTIRCRRENDRLVVEVGDDGCGVDSSRLESVSALGIQGMRERAQLLGGSFTIEKVGGHGTLVRVVFPLTRSTEAPAVSGLDSPCSVS